MSQPGGPLIAATHRRAAPVSVRVGLLVVCAALAAGAAHPGRALLWVAGLAVAGSLASLFRPNTPPARLARVAEVVVCAVGVALTGGAASPLFGYLPAPAFACGLADGAAAGLLVTPLVAGVALLVAGLAAGGAGPVGRFAAAGFQWAVLAGAAGLAGGWLRRPRPAVSRDGEQPYVAAYRLLSQLRTVARELSAGLDSVALAAGLLREMAAVAGYDRAAVFTRSAGERLVPLVHAGTERVDWDIDLSGEGPVVEGWLSQQPQLPGRQLSGGRAAAAGSALVLPLRIGLRSFGVVGVETDRPNAYPPPAVTTLQRVADAAALRLGTALLFDEIREMATVEERRRLAREIHDGIAQELASLGYLVDGLSAEARAVSSPLTPALTELRGELSRIISELRLSIFDLRSDVERHGGLGAALSEYLRAVGQGSPLTVHLSLDEQPTRLPADVEAELLRIAQEAITNARRHAGARNLWVNCTVDPPRAVLRVEDDGAGLGRGREDSFGLEIMKERAHRLHAQLSIADRPLGGTVVQLLLGRVAPPPDPVAPDSRGAGTR